MNHRLRTSFLAPMLWALLALHSSGPASSVASDEVAGPTPSRIDSTSNELPTAVAGIVHLGDRPAVGVRVHLVAVPEYQTPDSFDLHTDLTVTSTDTAGSGRFRLTAPRAGVYRLVVEAEGLLTYELAPVVVTGSHLAPPAFLATPARTQVQVLPPGTAKEGLAGVDVLARSAGWTPMATLDGWRPALRRAVTDADGVASLPRGGGEAIDLRVELHGGPYEGAQETRLGVTEARVRMRPRPPLAARPASYRNDPSTSTEPADSPRTIYGRVLHAATRRPLAGVVVWQGRQPGSHVVTDSDGAFRLPVTGERNWIQAEAAGLVPQRLWIEAGTRDESFEVLLRTARELRGAVVDTLGRPVADASLAIRRLDETDDRESVTPYFPGGIDAVGLSDDDGRFALHLEPGRRYHLLAGAPGYRSTESEFEVAADGRPGASSGPLEIVLRPSLEVRGRVVGPEDRPVAEAVVRTVASGRPLVRPEPEEFEERETADPSRTPRAATSEEEPVRNPVRTDADGFFAQLSIPAEYFDLAVYAAGFEPVVLRGLDAGTPDLGTLVLRPSPRLTGTVTDPLGAPVADAAVHLLREIGAYEEMSATSSFELSERRPDAVTDSAGRFRLDQLRRGERLHLYVRGDGYRGRWLRHLVLPTGDIEPEPLWIELERAEVIRGHVVDAEGRGVERATVLASHEEPVADDLPDLVARIEGWAAFTDADGYYELAELPAGRLEIQVKARDFVVPPPRRVERVPGEPAEPLDWVLERGAELEGHVTTESGAPVARAAVHAGGHKAKTDADGLYRMAGLPDGEQEVRVVHRHHGELVDVLSLEEGVNEHDVVFPDGVQVSGQALDAYGEPLGGVIVLLVTSFEDGAAAEMPARHEALTDPDGLFRFEPVIPGDYELTAHKDGWTTTWTKRPLRVAASDVEDLELELRPGAILRGEILGLDFDQLSDVTVLARSDGRGIWRGRVVWDGTYEIEGLAPGEWDVRATLDHGRRQTGFRLAVDPGRDELRRDLEFDRGVALRGEVLLDGEPLVGARVHVLGHEVDVARHQQADADGRFDFEHLEPGGYKLEVTHAPSRTVHNQNVEIYGDRDLRIDLRPARVEGRVTVAEEGTPVENGLVAMRRLADLGGEENLLTVGTDADGGFRFARVPPGRYRLAVRKDGLSAAETDLVVEASTPHTGLELEVERTAGAELVLVGPSMPGNVLVSATSDAGEVVLREARDVEPGTGTVTLPTLPAGRWLLTIQADGWRPADVDVDVPSAPRQVPFEPAHALEVQVPALVGSDYSAQLRIVDGAGRDFVALDAHAMPRTGWPVRAGRAEVPVLPAGDWQLLVDSANGAHFSGTVQLPDAPSPGYRTVVRIE